MIKNFQAFLYSYLAYRQQFTHQQGLMMNKIYWINAIEYIRINDCNAPQVETTIRRFVMKPDGFSISGTRATKHELADYEQWAKQHLLPELTYEQWQERINKVLSESGLTKAQQRSHRCYAIKFINCLKELGYLLALIPPKEESNSISKKPVLKRRYPDLVVEKSRYNRPQPRQRQTFNIVLSFKAETYLELYQFLHPELTDVERLSLIQCELNRLNKELKEFQKYLGSRTKSPLRLFTQQETLKHIKQLWGWCFYRTQDLASLSLARLIPVVDTRINLSSFESLHEFYAAKGRLDSEAEKAAEEVVEFLIDFFDNYGPHYSKETKLFYVKALVNLGKFLYRRITRKTKTANYQDIEVICALKAFSAELPKDPLKFKELPLTLKELRKILEIYKQHVDDPVRYSVKNGKVNKRSRRKRHIARDLQRFLMLALLCVVPPLRRRTLAELELGRTLVHGIETESGFIPRNKMSNSAEALYYYDMLPDAYKTGAIYGNYFVNIPNYLFQDGSCFYDYLNKWLYEGYREEFLLHGQTHQYLFVRVVDGKGGSLIGDPIPYGTYGSTIASLTKKFAGIEIRPQIFRAIYRTHYVNIGAPPEVLESLAFFMQHSPETAARVYTRQSLSEKLAPLKRFNLEYEL